MNALGRYRDEHGLTDDQVAEELSALLGRQIKPMGVRLKSGKGQPPKEWADALGLPPEMEFEYEFAPSPGLNGSEADTGGSSSPPGDPPTRPPGARVQPAPTPPSRSGDYAMVRDRIAKFYGAIGAGVSMATRNDGYGKVTDTYSKDLADAWIAAAQANPHVQKIVDFANSGGPVGELVVTHVILVLGFVYVSGKGPDLDFLYERNFGTYRREAIARAHIADVLDADGASANGATSSVGNDL